MESFFDESQGRKRCSLIKLQEMSVLFRSQEEKEQLRHAKSTTLRSRLAQLNEVYQDLEPEETRCGSLDSECVLQISSIGLDRAKSIRTGNKQFNPMKFTEIMCALRCDRSGGGAMDAFSQSNDGREPRRCSILFRRELRKFGTSVSKSNTRIDGRDVEEDNDENQSNGEKRMDDHSWIRFRDEFSIIPRRILQIAFFSSKALEKEMIVKLRNTVKRERARRSSSVAEIQVPEKVSRLEQGVESTLREVGGIYKRLSADYKKNNSQSVDLYRFIVDRQDYGTTLQNVFHLSFLLKDGKAACHCDADHQPVIVPLDSRSAEGTARKTEFVFCLSYLEWQEILKLLDDEDSRRGACST